MAVIIVISVTAVSGLPLYLPLFPAIPSGLSVARAGFILSAAPEPTSSKNRLGLLLNACIGVHGWIQAFRPGFLRNCKVHLLAYIYLFI
jgi:hypothetical protein